MPDLLNISPIVLETSPTIKTKVRGTLQGPCKISGFTLALCHYLGPQSHERLCFGVDNTWFPLIHMEDVRAAPTLTDLFLALIDVDHHNLTPSHSCKLHTKKGINMLSVHLLLNNKVLYY